MTKKKIPRSDLSFFELLLLLFIVLLNDSDGKHKETPYEKDNNYLFQATSTGVIEFKGQFNEIIAMSENENKAHELIQEEYNR